MFSPLIFVNLDLPEVMAVCLLSFLVMWYLSSCDCDTAGVSETALRSFVIFLQVLDLPVSVKFGILSSCW